MIRFTSISLVAVAGLAGLAACSKDNPYYCDEVCQAKADGGADSATVACTTNTECTSAGTPVCDTTQSKCVACTAQEPGVCTGTSPVCVVGVTNSCAPCATHDQCDSEACMPTGACGTDANVAYVAMTNSSDSNPCTHDSPCATLTHAATVKSFVKLQSDITEMVSLANVNVTVLAAPGTLIQRVSGNDTPVFTVSGTSNVTLNDVVIRGGTTSLGHGISVASGANGVQLTLDRVAVINNAGLGLSIGGGTLTMSRCVVSNNTSGGAGVVADFDITNSIFVVNGAGNSTIAGIALTPGATKHTFAFNTVSNNMSTTNNGISCAAAMSITNSIITGNAVFSCTSEYGLFDSGAVGTNKNGMPRFVNVLATNPLAADYYRIASNSDAINSADAAATEATDIDGDNRPQAGVRDIGADEYK